MSIRDVAPVVCALSRLKPLAPSHRRVDPQHIDSAVIGVCPRGYVVRPVELSVHHHHHFVAQPFAASHDVRNCPRRRPVVERHPHRIKCDLGRTRVMAGVATARSRQVAAGYSDVTNRHLPRAMPHDPVAKFSIRRDNAQVRRAHSRFTPRLTLAYRHRFARRSRQLVARLRPPPRWTRRRHRGTTDRQLARRCDVFAVPARREPAGEARR
ncbi:MAG: hypothetical protein QOE09_2528 [Ilumatobacteraceae bacterium]